MHIYLLHITILEYFNNLTSEKSIFIFSKTEYFYVIKMMIKTGLYSFFYLALFYIVEDPSRTLLFKSPLIISEKMYYDFFSKSLQICEKYQNKGITHTSTSQPAVSAVSVYSCLDIFYAYLHM